jgi:RimJ/RimL family protein N-acetyltransferase
MRLVARSPDGSAKAPHYPSLHAGYSPNLLPAPAAIALYKKFGFAVEGTRRGAAFRAGAFVDDHVMARVRTA